MRISDWSSDVCSSDLRPTTATRTARLAAALVFVLAASVLPAAAASVRLMAFGDSLTHGYGLASGETFPEQLEAALRADGLDRSEERRVGTECVRKCSSRWSPYN